MTYSADVIRVGHVDMSRVDRAFVCRVIAPEELSPLFPNCTCFVQLHSAFMWNTDRDGLVRQVCHHGSCSLSGPLLDRSFVYTRLSSAVTPYESVESPVSCLSGHLVQPVPLLISSYCCLQWRPVTSVSTRRPCSVVSGAATLRAYPKPYPSRLSCATGVSRESVPSMTTSHRSMMD